MVSRANRSSAESLIVTLMMIVVVAGVLGYCFSWSAVQEMNVSFHQTVRGLFNMVTCNQDLDPAALDVQELVSNLPKSEGEDRLNIIRQLGFGANSHWASHAVDPLVALLKEPRNNADVRIEAAQSLINLAGLARSAIPTMLNCLGDELGEVRQLAVCFLVNLGREMKQPLMLQLKSKDDRRFASAAMALSQYPTVSLQTVADRLENLAHHQDAVIRTQIAKALGQVQNSHAQRQLRMLLMDNQPEVRQEAVLSLGNCRQLQSQQVVAILKPALQDRDPSVRQSAVRVLSQYQDAGIEKMIEKLMHQEMDIGAKQSMSRALDRMIKSRRKGTN